MKTEAELGKRRGYRRAAEAANSHFSPLPGRPPNRKEDGTIGDRIQK